MPAGSGRRRIDRLNSIESGALDDVLDRIRAARRRIARIVHATARDKGMLISGRVRDRLYAMVDGQYAKLEMGLRAWSDELVTGSVRAGHEEAVRDIADAAGEMIETEVARFDKKYAEDVFKMIHPAQDRNLAAVFTRRMAEADIRVLRTATVDTFRQASLEGWTGREIHKQLQARWDVLAGDMAGDRFVDAAGRRWDNARYLQMLVRTTVTRADREGYMNTLAENGDDLVMVRNVDGEACEICQAWDGLIISITGASTDYPSESDARAAGLWHPNCRCMTERVDEDLDAAAIDRQAAEPTPDDLTDLRALNAYRAEVAP